MSKEVSVWQYAVPAIAAIVGILIGQAMSSLRERSTRDHAERLATRAEQVALRDHNRDLFDEAAVAALACSRALLEVRRDISRLGQAGKEAQDAEGDATKTNAVRERVTKLRQETVANIASFHSREETVADILARLQVRFPPEHPPLLAYARYYRRLGVARAAVMKSGDTANRFDLEGARPLIRIAGTRCRALQRRRMRFNDAAREFIYEDDAPLRGQATERGMRSRAVKEWVRRGWV